MEKIFKILVGLLITFSFSSCDPMKTLVIENKLDNDIIVEIELDNCNDYVTQLLSKKDLKDLKLETGKGENTKTFFLGFGIWTKKDLNVLKKCTKSIVIKETGKQSKKIEGEELNKLIKRKSPFNHTTRIRIKD
ncbi:MAG: hypothetical protein JXR05_01890 [Flavobacteriaceae bacterium]